MAAVLACRGRDGGAHAGGFLSHLSAAALWRLLPDLGGAVDVAIIGEAGREKRSGVRIHRPRTLEETMTTIRSGIPVTTPGRTVSDLERARPGRGGTTPAQLRRARREAAVLGLALGPGWVPMRTRSELEDVFLALCRRQGLPRPEVNVEIAGITVDFLWRDSRVVVETDGYRYHRGRDAFEQDHRRDLALRLAGFQPLRLSYEQVAKAPDEAIAALRLLLAAD